MITDESLRSLRADVMKEWAVRGKRTSWPDGAEALRMVTAALAGDVAARVRCVEILAARETTGWRPTHCAYIVDNYTNETCGGALPCGRHR